MSSYVFSIFCWYSQKNKHSWTTSKQKAKRKNFPQSENCLNRRGIVMILAQRLKQHSLAWIIILQFNNLKLFQGFTFEDFTNHGEQTASFRAFQITSNSNHMKASSLRAARCVLSFRDEPKETLLSLILNIHHLYLFSNKCLGSTQRGQTKKFHRGMQIRNYYKQLQSLYVYHDWPVIVLPLGLTQRS